MGFIDERVIADSSGKKLSDKIGVLSETVFYDEITWTKYTDATTNTDYHVTTIPNKDKNGNLIALKHGYAGDSITFDKGESARSFSARNGASFVANGGVFNDASATSGRINYGISIQDGVIKKSTNDTASYTYTLGIKADNTLVAYDHSQTADQILIDGSIQALAGFVPIIQNSVAVNSTIYSGITTYNQYHARNIIAQMPNKDILFITSNGGGTVKDKGLTYDDMIRICTSLGVAFAYVLDGGGSSQAVVRGNLLNVPVDDKGKTERKVADFLYVIKQSTYPQNLKTVSLDMGSVNKRVSDLRSDFNLLGAFNLNPTTVTNLDTIAASGIYWCLSTATSAPNTSNSWGIVHIQVGSLSAMQIAFAYDSTGTVGAKKRICNSSGVWQAWTTL